MTEFLIRPGVKEDASYVIATWLNHYKDHSYFALRIKRKIFFQSHHKVVTRILSRPETQVLVIHPAGEPEIIFGFLVYELHSDAPVIHMAFVQEKLRRQGLCRRLMREARIEWEHALFTHWTYTASDLVRRFPGLTYDPYRAEGV